MLKVNGMLRNISYLVLALLVATPAYAQQASVDSAHAFSFSPNKSLSLNESPPLPTSDDMSFVQPVSYEGMAAAASCGCNRCNASGYDTCCCDQRWAHRSSGYGQFLYLRARDAEVAYAQVRDGATPFGRTAVADPDYSSGVKIGFWNAWDSCSSIGASYTGFRSETSDQVVTNAPLSIASLVIHPGSVAAGSTGLLATASLDINFDQADITYRRIWAVTETSAVNWLAGVRYGHLQQDFNSTISVNGTTTVQSQLDFDGVGFTLGFDAERYAPCSGWLIYSKGNAAFLAGEFSGNYSQFDSTDPLEVQTGWKAGRIVPVLDLELGVGWSCLDNRLRLTTGYLVQSWFNTVNTDTWIQGVQNSNFTGLNDTMTFDGLTAKIEYVW